MASLQDVIRANETLRKRYDTATAIFTGATQGSGLGTLRAFAKHISHPKAIIVGRSLERFQGELQNLKTINPSGEFIFVEGQVSLIESIDAISKQMKNIVTNHSVDLLCMSPGWAPIEGRRFTTEGIDEMLALVYYCRLRLVQNLLEMGLMKPTGSVLSIFVGATEGRIFEDDLGLQKNYRILNMRGQFSAMKTLSFDRLAEQNPQMKFVHAHPGRVYTGVYTRSIENWFLWVLFTYIIEPLIFLGGITEAESGERMLYLAMGQEFGQGSGSSDYHTMSLDYNGAESESKWLDQYRLNTSLIDRIWEHNHRIFESAVSRE